MRELHLIYYTSPIYLPRISMSFTLICLLRLSTHSCAVVAISMVAPVRETAAQLLAVAALQLQPEKLRRTAGLLRELTTSKEWQTRHGGFCGLESLCAVAISGDNGGKGGEGFKGFLQREDSR